MLKNLQRKLPEADTLRNHLITLRKSRDITPTCLQSALKLTKENSNFAHFLNTTIIVSGRREKVVLPDDVDQITFPSFVRFLSSVSKSTSVLSMNVTSVDWEKPPVEEYHAALEALCESNWRLLVSVIGRKAFSHIILTATVFVQLRNACYFQVCGARVDDIIARRPKQKVAYMTQTRLDKPVGKRVPRKGVLNFKQPIYYSSGKIGYNMSLKDVLNQDKKVEVIDVLKNIFPITFDYQNDTNVPKRVVPFTELADKFVKKCRVSDFRVLLEKWFPINETYDKGHSINDVTSFCFAIFHELFPHAVFGSAENWTVLRTKLVYYLQLPPRQPPHINTLMQGFKLTQIEWLWTSDMRYKKSRDDMFKARELFEQLLIWLANRFLPQLLRSFFYFTDNLTESQIIYRLGIWQLKTREALQKMKETHFSPYVHTKSQLGVSKFRLVPKKNGFRPIVSLGRPVLGPKGSKQLAVNKRLANLFKVLSQEFKIGKHNKCGLESVDSMNRALARYKKRVDPAKQPLYFVKIDVTAAFDTIPAKEVLELSRKLLKTNLWALQKHTRTMPMSSVTRKLWFTTARACDGKSDSPLQAFRRLGTRGIIVDENRGFKMAKQTLSNLLNDHLFRNDVLIDGTVHRQIRGIPQGSVLSSLFCSMVYEEMIRDQLSDLAYRPDTCLMRYVDDFLLITTDQTVAVEFLDRVLKGIPKYGVSVNREKCVVNFPLPNIKQLQEGQRMTFLGLEIDTQNLQLHRMYPTPSALLWVDHGVKLASVSTRANDYFSNRFPRLLLNKETAESVVLDQVVAYFRYVFLRAVRTLAQFQWVSVFRLEQEMIVLAMDMIDLSLSIVENRCPHVKRGKLETWLTKSAVQIVEKRKYPKRHLNIRRSRCQ